MESPKLYLNVKLYQNVKKADRYTFHCQHFNSEIHTNGSDPAKTYVGAQTHNILPFKNQLNNNFFSSLIIPIFDKCTMHNYYSQQGNSLKLR